MKRIAARSFDLVSSLEKLPIPSNWGSRQATAELDFLVTVRNAAGNILDTHIAKGMPTRTVGRDRLTHERKDLNPMPGSITMGTAPDLNRQSKPLSKAGPGGPLVAHGFRALPSFP